MKPNSKSEVAFQASHKKKLRQLLSDAGVTKAHNAILSRLESEARAYRQVAGTHEEVAAIESRARAERIRDYAHALLNELREVDGHTYATMIEVMSCYDWESEDIEPPVSRGRRVMGRCLSAMDDLLFSAGAAMTLARRRLSGKRVCGAALRRLCNGVANEWSKATGRPMPNVEYERGGNKVANGIGLQVVVREHPLWVVLDALDIDVDAATLDQLIGAANGDKVPSRRRTGWRPPVDIPASI